MAESEEELKSLLMKVKEKSKKAGSTFKKQRSWHPVSSLHGNRWGNNGKGDRLYFLGSKITADGGCSHEIIIYLLLGRKAMTNLDSIVKSRDITLSKKVRLVKATVFPVVVYGCKSWTIKKAEHRRIDALRTVVLEKTLESPWICKIKPVHPKGNQS